jgi:hypothetical protein
VHVDQIVVVRTRGHLVDNTASECGNSSRTPSSAASRIGSAIST